MTELEKWFAVVTHAITRTNPTAFTDVDMPAAQREIATAYAATHGDLPEGADDA